MRILLYAGPAPSRESVIEYAAPIVQRCATALTLVTGGGAARQALLDDAARRLPVPDGASAQDRLIGFIGRDPSWRRP